MISSTFTVHWTSDSKSETILILSVLDVT